MDPESSIASLDTSGASTLEPGTAFVLLASGGDLAGVKREVESGAVSLESVDIDGSTALIAAAHQGHAPVVEYLLRVGANPNAVEERFGWTALIAASYGGHLPVVGALLEVAADTACIDLYKSWTALDYARDALRKDGSNSRMSIIDLLERAHAPSASVARTAAASAAVPESAAGSLPPPPPVAAPLLRPAASAADPLVGPRILSPSASSGGGPLFAPELAGLANPSPSASASCAPGPAGGLDGTSGAWAVVPAVYITFVLLGWLLSVL